MNTYESKLSYKTQQEVDEVIQEFGVRGLGYYYIYTDCPNCKHSGLTFFKLGQKAVNKNCICVKCRCDMEVNGG